MIERAKRGVNPEVQSEPSDTSDFPLRKSDDEASFSVRSSELLCVVTRVRAHRIKTTSSVSGIGGLAVISVRLNLLNCV